MRLDLRQRSPRSTACASAASTGTRRPATCSSSSTGTGAMHSPRPGACTRANRRLGDRRRRRRRRLGCRPWPPAGLAVGHPFQAVEVSGRARSQPQRRHRGLVLLVLSAAAALAWFGLVPGHSECLSASRRRSAWRRWMRAAFSCTVWPFRSPARAVAWWRPIRGRCGAGARCSGRRWPRARRRATRAPPRGVTGARVR